MHTPAHSDSRTSSYTADFSWQAAGSHLWINTSRDGFGDRAPLTSPERLRWEEAWHGSAESWTPGSMRTHSGLNQSVFQNRFTNKRCFRAQLSTIMTVRLGLPLKARQRSRHTQACNGHIQFSEKIVICLTLNVCNEINGEVILLFS